MKLTWRGGTSWVCWWCRVGLYGTGGRSPATYITAEVSSPSTWFGQLDLGLAPVSWPGFFVLAWVLCLGSGGLLLLAIVCSILLEVPSSHCVRAAGYGLRYAGQACHMLCLPFCACAPSFWVYQGFSTSGMGSVVWLRYRRWAAVCSCMTASLAVTGEFGVLPGHCSEATT